MTQHAPPSPRLRGLSVPAKPERRYALTFQWERFANIARELLPLFQKHYNEIAMDRELIPLDPDWQAYFNLDAGGVLHILTARNVKGNLVGYVFNLVGPHLHYASTRTAHTEMFWLDEAYRRGWAPVRMFTENLAGLKEREVIFTTIGFKLHFEGGRVGKLLSRLGYRPADITMRKVL